jgi:hypothetical protein
MKKLIAKIPDFLKLKLEFWKELSLSKTKFKKRIEEKEFTTQTFEKYILTNVFYQN